MIPLKDPKSESAKPVEQAKKSTSIFSCWETKKNTIEKEKSLKEKRTLSKDQRGSQPQSKIRKYMDFGLKQKLRLWVLLPLLVGICLTVGVSFLFIILAQPAWIQITGYLKEYIEVFEAKFFKKMIQIIQEKRL
jgi:Flp pilus assembly protein TadB